MQDFIPSEGVKVFIVSDSVTLLGSNLKNKTIGNPHLQNTSWPLLSNHFAKLTVKSMGGCITKDILEEVQRLVAIEAGGSPAEFRHIWTIMPTLNELCRDGHGNTIKNRDPTHGPIFKTLAEIWPR